MNTLKMVAITGITAFSISTTQATEMSYLYKDQRIMAMGGANVAAGGYSTSLFANPAGISQVSNEHGMVVELLGIQTGISSDSESLFSDLNDAIESEDEEEIVAVIENYAGQTVHFDLSNYSSLTNNHGKFAWSVGLLSAVDANITPHPNSFEFLEVQARAYGGLTTAFSYTFEPNQVGDLSLGLGLKLISQQSYEGTITPSELVDYNNLGDNIRDKMESNGTALGADLGAIYQFKSYLNPSIGISILNIGGLNFDKHYGYQPMTVNLGTAIQPKINFIKKTVIALDYVDLFNANQTRTYTLDNGDSVSYTDIDDTDFVKRIRFGASALIYDNTWSSLELAAGLYQGAYTAGFTVTASIIQIGFSTFEEQLGPEYKDQSDRRYELRTGLVW
ncbi:conjugal transfer protein TraF [Psychromonas sp.]|nr:conjugal transfer protein TraF [Psychromonas sp.]